MTPDRARIVEMIGAFLVGGGVVAVGYEMARPPDRGGADAVSAPAVASGEAAGSEVASEVEPAEPSDEAVAGDGAPQGEPALPDADAPPWRVPDATGTFAAFPPIYAEPEPFGPGEETEFPKHALVTSVAAIVRKTPELTAPIIGILHAGARLRSDAERSFGGGCKEGWHKIFPRGWVCMAAGLDVDAEPPDAGSITTVQPAVDAVLPYEYWRVNDEMTPFFHRLPSFGEQEQANLAGAAWREKHDREPMPTAPSERPKEVPAVVKEYMSSGFYVTKAGEEVKSQRRFLRTLRGAYARKYQLGQKPSPVFRGRLLRGKDDLPVHFVRREMALMRRENGTDVLVKSETVPTRLAVHPFQRRIHVGTVEYFEDDQGLLLPAYAVGEAYKLKRPPGVDQGERWVHIDLSEQVLVAYEGDEPVMATLVSTGKAPGMTPVGVHRMQIKHIATTMRDQPIEDEAYSIDDVPWTQYFHGSIALHGAFWHAGFGIERSHGCVNLSPADARWLFGFTEPHIPPGWHAAAPTRKDKGSAVVVTD